MHMPDSVVLAVAQRGGGESGSADTDESMADVLAWLLKDGASTAGGEQAMSIASLQVRALFTAGNPFGACRHRARFVTHHSG